MKERLITQARVVAANDVEPQRIHSQRRVKVTEGVCAQSVKTHSRIAGAASDVEVKRKLPNGSIPDAGYGLAKGTLSLSGVEARIASVRCWDNRLHCRQKRKAGEQERDEKETESHRRAADRIS